jgi:hypothetical protein
MPRLNNPNMGRPVHNKYKVPMKQWNKWSNLAKRVFNNMMETMRPQMQHAFLHPHAQLMKKLHWDTTRWNASWEAAQAANGGGALKRVINTDGTTIPAKKKKAARRGK